MYTGSCEAKYSKPLNKRSTLKVLLMFRSPLGPNVPQPSLALPWGDARDTLVVVVVVVVVEVVVVVVVVIVVVVVVAVGVGVGEVARPPVRLRRIRDDAFRTTTLHYTTLHYT